MRERFVILLAAAGLEALAGYPRPVWAALGHPVSWVGRALDALEARGNDAACRPAARACRGTLSLGLVLAAAGLAGRVAGTVGGRAGTVVALATLLASRGLDDHVAAVASALERAGAADAAPPDALDEARRRLGRIVGRDTATLDRPAIARAAIESLAENMSDGVVAPALFFGLAGLPGCAVYKAANTADSMWGHRTARHRDWGWAAARLDDGLNFPASRLSALLLALASRHPRRALRTARRDAPRHRSPNAGWPEAAMAGALGFRLNGPRRYGGALRDDAWTGDGRTDLTAADIRRALRLYRRALGLGGCLILLSATRPSS